MLALKLLYKTTLFFVFFFVLLQATMESEHFVNQKIDASLNYLNRIARVYLNDHNFLKNPSFEESPDAKQIPSWTYTGWQINSGNAFHGKASVNTIDQVKNSSHNIKQTIYFFFPAKSHIQFSFSELTLMGSPSDQIINLTAYHFDQTVTSQNLGVKPIASPNWQTFLNQTFTLSKSAYRIDIAITVPGNSPTYIDNTSLIVLTTEKLQ